MEISKVTTLCVLLLLRTLRVAALGDPDLHVYVGYYAGMYYRNFYIIQKATSKAPVYPNAGWEFNLAFSAYSLDAKDLPENSNSNFKCFYYCLKTSPTWRHTISDDKAFITADNGCDMSVMNDHQEFCLPGAVTGTERFVVGYFKNPDDPEWDFMFVQPQNAKMLPTGTYAVGDYFSHPPPLVPARDYAMSQNESVNRWKIMYSFNAKLLNSATCYGGYELVAGTGKCDRCPQGTFRTITAREANLKCDICPLNSQAFVKGATQSLSCVCDAGYESTTDPSKVGAAAKMGGYTVDKFCVACSPGFFGVSDKCNPCLPGFYSPSNATAACTPTDPGFFQNASGQTKQIACPPGTANPSTVMSKCIPCGPGQYSGKNATTFCSNCPRGRYAAGDLSTSCDECPAKSTTEDIGSVDISACTCTSGQYYAGSQLGCLPCEYGMRCPGGLGEPLTDASFYLEPTGSKDTQLKYSAYRCVDDYICPGDLYPLQCPTGRIGLACDRCEAGRFAADDGTCQSCTNAGLISRVVFTLLGCLLALLAFVVLAIREAKVGARQSKIVLTCVVAITLTSLQVLGALTAIQIPWMEPLVFLKTLLAIFKLDIDFLEPSCLFNTDSTLARYIFSIFVLPVVLFVLFLIFRVFKCFDKQKRLTVDNEISSYGKIVQILFLGISLLCLSSFQCIPNPGAVSTMAKYRSVKCWQGGHVGFLVVSILATLFVLIPFITIIVRASVLYAYTVSKPGGIAWLKRYGFIFLRFRGDRHYYGVIHLLRSFFIALSPVVFSWNVQAQLLVLAGILTSTMGIQAACWPWRGRAANYLDVAFSCGLLMLLTGGSMLAPHDDDAKYTLQVFAITVVSASVLIGLVAGGLNMYRALFPPKTYAIFLSHHKGGAAVFARFMKEMMKTKVRGKIFLDSDELDNLDLIFSVVAEQTKNFVLLLTAETLSRMWCAGEIVSAVRHKIPIVVVTTETYAPPSDEWIENLDLIWTSMQLSTLSKFGVEIEDIKAAYKHLKTLPSIAFDSFAAEDKQMECIKSILGACKSSYSTIPVVQSAITQVSESADSTAEVLISGRAKDSEAVYTARVIQILIQQKIRRSVKLAYKAEDIKINQNKEKYLLVVLMRGLLEDPDFAGLLHEANESGIEVVPVLADTSFGYPDSAFYDKLSAGEVFRLDTPIVKEIGIETIANYYKKLFTVLALSFTAHGSSIIQDAEMEVLSRLFRWEAVDGLQGKRLSSSGSMDKLMGPPGDGGTLV